MKELNLMVCPHDMARNPEGWHRMGQYLNARIDMPISFSPSFDFAEFRQHLTSADLVYGNATDSLSLLDTQGFRPLARPADTYDEALLIAGPDGVLRSIEAIHGAAVATVTHLLPTRLALRTLRGRGITPSNLMHRDSWLSVVRSVWNGEAPFGILYRDAYDELSAQSRGMIRILESTDDRSVFHMFCARPETCDSLPALTDLLTAMSSDPEGKLVLADLRILEWLPITNSELAGLRSLLV
jgi:hypothetical protein